MKKRIKNFFTGIVGLVLLGAIFNVDPKKIGSAIGIITIIAAVAAICYVVYLLIKFFVWLSRLYSESSPTSTPSSAKNLNKITITVDEPAPSRFSASIDKDDYDYAYSHVGLFRPEGTPGPMPKIGTEVFFREEPDNPYDAEAVKAVWYCNGEERLVGYFYRSDSTIREMARDWITRGDNYYSAITGTYDKPRLFIGFNK